MKKTEIHCGRKTKRQRRCDEAKERQKKIVKKRQRYIEGHIYKKKESERLKEADGGSD